MYVDDTIIAGLLAVAGTLAVGGYVLYYVWHDIKMKNKHKAH